MRKKSIGREIIFMLAAGGVITLGLILAGPNIMRILKALKRDYNKRSRQRIKAAISELARREIVSLQQKGYETYIKLTPEGQRQILRYKIDELKFKRQKQWDGKWRIIVFDVPERLKKARTALSSTLRRAGAYQFQKSVFVYPYDCQDDVGFVAEIFGVEPFVKYIEANYMDGERILKSHFKIYS